MFVPILIYGNETMLWKEKERSRITAVQMDNLSIKRMDRVPDARIRGLCGVKKRVVEDERIDVFSGGSVMWKEWRRTGLPTESL